MLRLCFGGPRNGESLAFLLRWHPSFYLRCYWSRHSKINSPSWAASVQNCYLRGSVWRPGKKGAWQKSFPARSCCKSRASTCLALTLVACWPSSVHFAWRSSKSRAKCLLVRSLVKISQIEILPEKELSMGVEKRNESPKAPVPKRAHMQI